MYEFYNNDKYWSIVDSIYFKLFSSLALLIEAIRSGVSENTSAIIKAGTALVPVFEEEASTWSNFSIWAWIGGIIFMLIFGFALNIYINSDDKPGSGSSNIDFNINNQKIGSTTTENIYNKIKDIWNSLFEKKKPDNGKGIEVIDNSINIKNPDLVKGKGIQKSFPDQSIEPTGGKGTTFVKENAISDLNEGTISRVNKERLDSWANQGLLSPTDTKNYKEALQSYNKLNQNEQNFVDHAIKDIKKINDTAAENVNKLIDDSSSSSGSSVISNEISRRKTYIERQKQDILDNLNQENTKNHFDLIEKYNEALDALNNNNTSKFTKLQDKIMELKQKIWSKIENDTSNSTTPTIKPAEPEKINTLFDSISNKLKPEETPIVSANSGYTSSYSAVHSEPGDPFEYQPFTQPTSTILDQPIVETPTSTQNKGEDNTYHLMDEWMKSGNRPYVPKPEVDNYNIHSPLEEYYYLALINPLLNTIFIILLLIVLISSIMLYIDTKCKWKDFGVIPVHDWENKNIQLIKIKINLLIYKFFLKTININLFKLNVNILTILIILFKFI
jgi:hypothetical protein